MVYQLSNALLSPYDKLLESAPKSFADVAGVEDKNHDDGARKSILVCEPSKSSTYIVDSPLNLSAFGVSGCRNASSPRNEKFEGTSVSMFGSLLTHRVKNGSSVEKLVLIPKIELFTDSCP